MIDWSVHLLFFTCSAFDFCTAESDSAGPVSVLAAWSWLKNATFKSTEEFMGMQVDVWTYTV